MTEACNAWTIESGKEPTHPARILFQLTSAQSLFVAHEMGLFEVMAGRTWLLPEICDKLGLEKRPAQALLSMCASQGFLQRGEDGRYSLTKSAEHYLLRSSVVSFCGVFDQCLLTPDIFSFASLKKALLTNQSQVYGEEKLFAANETSLKRTKAFTRSMHSKSLAPALAWPHVIDLGAHRCLLDVGGGSGAHSIGACRIWPHLEAVVFDRPLVCSIAEEFIAAEGLSTRIATQHGNMWDCPFPEADVHFYSDIFHDWPAERCAFLARKSFESLPPGGKIFIHEMLFNDEKTGPFNVAAYNVQMLLWTEGQQFPGKELCELLGQAGFCDMKVAATGFGDWRLVSAVKGGG